MNTLSKFVVPGIVFFLTLAFGFWLNRSGRPYNGLLFNTHKLMALAAVVLTVIRLVRIFKSISPPALSIILLVLAPLCVAALFVSGALMSADKLDYAWLHMIHRIAAAALVVVLPAAVFMFMSKP